MSPYKNNDVFTEQEFQSEDILLKRDPDGTPLANIDHTIVRHSPTGFNWGYEGSGPADLSLNILLHFVAPDTAEDIYQNFKRDVISKIPPQGGIIKAEHIKNWLLEY